MLVTPYCVLASRLPGDELEGASTRHLDLRAGALDRMTVCVLLGGPAEAG
jgi:hypothetical protein